jgi:hypothetical protein
MEGEHLAGHRLSWYIVETANQLDFLKEQLAGQS